MERKLKALLKFHFSTRPQFLSKILVLIFGILICSPMQSSAWLATHMRKGAKKSFFVMTNQGTQGNLGGLSGANAYCLNDLQSYTWVGKSEAVLNSATVKAYLCDSSTCNNLQPNRTYYFAVSGYSYGGASFTTDGVGSGPGNSDNWGDTTHFGNPIWYFWTNRLRGSDPNHWPLTQGTAHCSNWTSSSGGGGGGYAGTPGTTNADRWNDNASLSCVSSVSLVCIVEPP